MIFSRDCGFFSNLNVFKRTISEKIRNGEEIKNIKFYFNLYSDEDIYNECYYQDQSISISKEEGQWVLDNCYCDNLGLFNFTNIDLSIINKLNKKYLNLNSSVLNYIQDYKIDEPYIFVWARKTDKIIENPVPEYEEYVRRINSLPNLKVIVTTDDIELGIKFKEGGYKLVDMPMSNLPTHYYYNSDMSKMEYIKRLLAIVEVASQSEYFISYGGNIATTVYEKHKNKNNCFLYKNGFELYNLDR